MSIDCVLLAAGSGKRFGGDKLQHPVNGIPMIRHACMLYAGLPLRNRILAVRPSDPVIAACGREFAFRVVENPDHEKGIGTSTAVGARELLREPELPDAVLYGVSDQPYLTAETVIRLIDAWEKSPGCICLPACGGRRGNPVLFPGNLLSELVMLDADIGGKTVIRNHEQLVIPVEIENAREMKDIDYADSEKG